MTTLRPHHRPEPGPRSVPTRRAHAVRIGEADPRLTPNAGLSIVAELDRVLGVSTHLAAAGVNGIKVRNRGLSGAQLLLSLASAHLAGADFWTRLDEHRTDTAGQQLCPVPTPASTTAAGLARRFTPTHLAGIETAIGAVNDRLLQVLPPARREQLLTRATIDGDTTDVEVYGSTKEEAEHAYTGARVLRPHLLTHAETGVPLAADLLGGRGDPRSSCVHLLERAIAALPAGVKQIHTRWDAGYFAADLAYACQQRGVRFAIGVKRNSAVVRAAQSATAAGHLDEQSARGWTAAIGMEHTDLALIDYLPGAWPAGTESQPLSCIARRTRVRIADIPTAQARKRRTIPADQLALALGGHLDDVGFVYAYSFILTDLDCSTGAKIAEVEHWYRHRTDIEAFNKDAKHGAGLRHLPSASHAANSVWMWAALLACAFSAWMQELTSLGTAALDGVGRGRMTLPRLRRELINVPARLIHRARRTWLRLPPGDQLLAQVLPRLQAAPTAPT